MNGAGGKFPMDISAPESPIDKQLLLAWSGAAAGVSDELPIAVLVLDRALGIRFASALATSLLQTRNEFHLGVEMLRARRSQDHLTVVAAVGAALDFGTPGIVTFRSRAGAPTFVISLRRMAGGGVVLAALVPLQTVEVAAEQVFIDVLGLSPAEARLARRLAAGDSITEAALQNGVTLSTARWTLRALLAKSGVRNQVSLMALLTRLAQIG